MRIVLIVTLWISALIGAETLKYGYDSSGRLITATSSKGTVITYTYDAAGNILRKVVSSPASSTTVAVSAASLSGATIAPGTLVSIFGAKLATATATSNLPWPTTLGGTTVSVTDSANTARAASIFAISPTQANVLIPADTKPGPASIQITASDGVVTTTRVTVEAVSPGLFAANASGQGLAAALLLRVEADGTQTTEPVVAVSAAGALVPAPIAFNGGDQLFVLLFGTGIQGGSGAAKARLSIAGVTVPVFFAGAQGQFPGLDQVNAGPLPLSLKAAGQVTLSLSIDGRPANPVTLVFR